MAAEIRTCSRAPVRVDPAGGGTDCPPFCVEHGGLVVSFSVARYVHAAFQRLPAGSGVFLYSHDTKRGAWAPALRDLDGAPGLEFLKAFVRRLAPSEESFVLSTDSGVPERAGLGGSASVGVALASVLDRAYGRTRTLAELAELANDVERTDLRNPGGSQDSYGAALGGINRIQYRRGGGTSHAPIRVSAETVARLERDSLLIYTGGAHLSGSIHEDIKKSYALPDSPTVKAMTGLRQEAAAMAKALEVGDLTGYARALNRSRFHHYTLHESCDSPVLRKYFKALERLILGGKTCGAGGGGFILVLARPERRRECVETAESLGGLVWPLKIDTEGVKSWTEEGLTEEAIGALREAIQARSPDVPAALRVAR